MSYLVTEHREPPHHLVAVRFEATPAEIPERIGGALAEVFGYLGRHGVTPAGPPVGHYEMVGPEHFVVRAGCFVPEPVATEDGVVGHELPARRELRTEHVGSYADLPRAYDALQKYAAEHGRELDLGEMWEEYVSGPEVPPTYRRTIVHWPLA